MKRKSLRNTAFALFASILLTSCATDNELIAPPVVTTFRLGMDTQTRAAQALNPTQYPTKLYLYKATADAMGETYYAFDHCTDVSSQTVTLENLEQNNRYKAVFLSIPAKQTPALPEFTETQQPYEKAQAEYIHQPANNQQPETDNDLFRSIVDFTASPGTGTQNAVLTRQNGALEVRIKGISNLSKVELHLKGHTSLLLQDGTGGQVLTQGEPVALSKVQTFKNAPTQVRIRINLLPQEDITDRNNGNDNYLLVTTDVPGEGTGIINQKETKYPIRSAHPSIPIYPNQVTWLTLGKDNDSSGGNFEVSFGDKGNIDLEDGDWDGWNDNYAK